VFTGPASFSSGQGPVGLAFDRSGNLFVSTEGNQPNDRILKFTPAGAVSTFATGLSQIPRGLAFSANGHLFVAETGNAAPGDIVEFTLEGARTLFASGLGRPEGNGGAEFLAFKRGGSLLP
jgi:sugar lactone lactonase YvrE